MIGRIISNLILLIPLAGLISYYDVRFRRIPNVFVLGALAGGLAASAWLDGWSGVAGSLAGCGVGFGLMLILHLFGALGAGDVKLFAAVGAIIGLERVLPAFLIILMTGGVLAVLMMFRSGTVRETMERVVYIFHCVLFQWRVPQIVMPADKKQTIPYGVAIMVGSLITLAANR
jgi:prepilin peptidase CpaA